MPVITRWFARLSLIYLLMALVVQVALAARGFFRLPSWLAGIGPVYFHLFMVGWVTQLIFGVVYWMFPKWSQERPRGYDSLAWACLALLNVGLLLRAVGEPALAAGARGIWPGVLIASALLQWLAGLAFVVNTWRRVKER